MGNRNILWSLLLSFCCIFLFTGCGSDTGEGKILRYDLPQGATSIDPQFSTSDAAEIIIQNTFEGLFQYDSHGDLQYDIATNYTLSEDKLEYTFTLRENSFWSNGERVTAHDFEFALKRMFNQEAPSPFATHFISIRNAEEILKGEQNHQNLDVTALDSKTLKIRLAAPNPYFLTLLAGNAAMPCNEKFLIQSKGRYGLDLKSILFNGPFYVRNWDNNLSINLRKNKHYSPDIPIVAAGVNFYIGRADPLAQFFDGKSDGIFVEETTLAQLSAKTTVEAFPSTNWVILFNQNQTGWNSAKVRTALASAIDLQAIQKLALDSYAYTPNIIPHLIQVGNHSYRELAGDLTYRSFQNLDIQSLLQEGLDEQEIKRLPKTTILLPDSSMGRSVAQELQKVWGKKLSFFVNLSYLPETELRSAVATGNYQIALYPLVAKNDSPITALQEFSSTNTGNVTHFQDGEYDQLVYEAMHSRSTATSTTLVKTAEQMLLDKAVVIPLFASNSYFVMNEGVSGIEASPFYHTCHFQMAKRMD